MDVLPPRRPQETTYALTLTPNQREIALLVEAGLTNREIAARLGTTAGWVGTQIGRIVQRLGLTCRADIAAWVIKDDLCRSGRWERVV
jgi:DNA-binding NarL/FixJ family response regulator